MKKKILSGLLAGTMMVTLLAGCGSKADDGANTAGEAKETTEATETTAAEDTSEEAAAEDTVKGDGTTFTVGFDAEYPPYGYMDENGDYTGFDLELAQAVCDLEGWELVKTPINWDSKDMELDSGNIDCIWNGFTINGREEKYTWSDPYVNNAQVIVTSEDSGINSLADLAGKNVGVQAASAALDLLQGDQKELMDTFAVLQEFPDYNNAFVELQTGSIDAIAMDIGVAKYQIKSRGEGCKILDETLNSEKYGIGFKIGNEELRDKVNADLQTLLANGTFAEIAGKYEEYGLVDMLCLEEK